MQRNYICNPKALDLNNPMRLSQFLLWHQKVEPIPLFFLLGLDTTREYISEMVQRCYWDGTLRYKSYTEKTKQIL